MRRMRRETIIEMQGMFGLFGTTHSGNRDRNRDPFGQYTARLLEFSKTKKEGEEKIRSKVEDYEYSPLYVRWESQSSGTMGYLTPSNKTERFENRHGKLIEYIKLT